MSHLAKVSIKSITLSLRWVNTKGTGIRQLTIYKVISTRHFLKSLFLAPAEGSNPTGLNLYGALKTST